MRYIRGLSRAFSKTLDNSGRAVYIGDSSFLATQVQEERNIGIRNRFPEAATLRGDSKEVAATHP
jgi:hypothetical protein